MRGGKRLQGNLLPEERALTSAFQPRGNVGRAGAGQGAAAHPLPRARPRGRPRRPDALPMAGGDDGQRGARRPFRFARRAGPAPGSPPLRLWLFSTCPAVSAVCAEVGVGHRSDGGHRGGRGAPPGPAPRLPERAAGEGAAGLAAPRLFPDRSRAASPHTRRLSPRRLCKTRESCSSLLAAASL